ASTSLAFICTESGWLTESLLDADRRLRPSWVALFNKRVGKSWDVIRQFLALHYKFDDRLDTPFWRECREKTDLCTAVELVEYYQENGPSALWYKSLLNPDDQFQMEGYLAMLVGQRVPYHSDYVIPEAERRAWEWQMRTFEAQAKAGYSVRDALALVRSPD